MIDAGWVSTEELDVSWQHCGQPGYWEDDNVYCSKCQEMLPNDGEWTS